MVAVAQSLREQVAWACWILAAEGYADLTLGHVSGRGADGEIWIKRKGVALDEVETEDVVALEDTDAVLHLETVLHTGVYRAREDVGAVVHGHPPHATAFARLTVTPALAEVDERPPRPRPDRLTGSHRRLIDRITCGSRIHRATRVIICGEWVGFGSVAERI